MKLRNIINTIIIVEIIWFIIISESNDLKTIIWSFIVFGITLFARINHKNIVQFFKEKEAI